PPRHVTLLPYTTLFRSASRASDLYQVKCACDKVPSFTETLFFPGRPRRRRLRRSDDVGQLDAIVLAPDVGEPMPDIAAQHEGVVGGLVTGEIGRASCRERG